MFNLLISRNAFFDNQNQIRGEIKELINRVKKKDIRVVLVTRTINKYKKLVNEQLGNDSKIKYVERKDVSKRVVSQKSNIILVGAVDQDIYIAANNKILMINPAWLDNIEEKVLKYGFELENIDQLLQCIEIMKMDIELFYDQKIDSKTRLIALSNANKFRKMFGNEEDMIRIYKSTLKFGDDYYKYALYFHYLTVITGLREFEDVDYWMGVPSSSGANENVIYDLVQQTRYLMKNQRKDEMFIRHTPAEKSTYMKPAVREKLGCSRHLQTIKLNPKYKGKLKGKKVCVIDDYVTNGPSFECTRNLLINEGVEEIILLAIGTFRKPYIKEDITVKGDPFLPGYDFETLNREYIYPKPNVKAQEVINDIHRIIS